MCAAVLSKDGIKNDENNLPLPSGQLDQMDPENIGKVIIINQKVTLLNGFEKLTTNITVINVLSFVQFPPLILFGYT